MKITSVDVFPLKIRNGPVYLGTSIGQSDESDYYIRPEYRSIYSRNLETLLVKITTDSGIYGWGEALAPVGPEIAGEIIERLFKNFLIGQDPRDIDVIWSRLYDSMRERGYFTGFMVDALTAVDVALWDILGKSVQLPVYQLLGGAYRREIPAYVSGIPKQTREERIELALEWKSKGFTAIKLHLGFGVYEDAEIAAYMREALGPRFRLMVDAHWQYSVPEAIRLGRALERLNIEFLEAPTAPEDIEGTAEITRALDIAIAIGEAKRTRYQFKDRLLKRAADIYQPDIGRTGITEARKIANLADAFNIPIAPHLSVGQGICIAATLHLSAAISNLLIVEYQPTVMTAANSLLVRPLVCEQGRYLLPEGPGLGVDIDEEQLRKHMSA
ncbi:mandelate racemase/muconate lactonizing enzyme family protein [Paenibacillus sp. WQ 127069]|uniref:Mandelate racemase/muconate lactonizing enzyme family protein n=1 Tax=Paenibacillus baimaensis TaxID=2982185 RepID=A0ABT2UCH7_9BACL|nr:mandelate racemase/muconate lactonizing enzyme family protein [Paenibacillus sp. WQ 127069]MCU6792295.1 mandelate racemase/muconate lactonizing enzyme family protein [Paenibacillus sp. WQ 127069]